MIGKRHAKTTTEREGGEKRKYLVFGDQRIELGVDVETLSTDELVERIRNLQQATDKLQTLRKLYPDNPIPISWIILLGGFALIVQSSGQLSMVLLAFVGGIFAVVSLPFLWMGYKKWYYSRLTMKALTESSEAVLELANRDEDLAEEVTD